MQHRLAELQLELDSNVLEVTDLAHTTPATQQPVPINAATRVALRKHEEIERAYRIVTGISFFKVTPNQALPHSLQHEAPNDNLIGIAFDTSYHGSFIESYFIVLHHHHATQQFTIRNHTIPYFVPVSMLAAQYLNTDLKTFITALSEYLDAVAKRRIELQQELAT
jgi:hypothetical protein